MTKDDLSVAEPGTIRVERCSAPVALGLAMIAFLLFWVDFVIILGATVAGPWHADLSSSDSRTIARVSLGAAGAALAAYLPTRLIYRTARWDERRISSRRCVRCDYDLTGNASGTCPECGAPARARAEPPRPAA